MEMEREAKRKRHGRIFRVCLLLLLLACACAWIWQRYAKTGAVAKVEVDGACVAYLSLEKDGTYVVPVDNGENVLCVENGNVYMQTADCPDKTCVLQGKIRRQGECIVCLPHKVVVTVLSESDEAVDAVT